MGYDCITSSCCSEDQTFVLDLLWTLNIPLKICCFTWLLGRGRILTWEQLQHRGYQGPSWCVLCGLSAEDIQHLFLDYSFSIGILSYFAAQFGYSSPHFESVSSFWGYWFRHTAFSAHYRYLPIFIFWCIWKLRNSCLFDFGVPTVHILISQIDSLLNLYPVPQKNKNLGTSVQVPWSFFFVASLMGKLLSIWVVLALWSFSIMIISLASPWAVVAAQTPELNYWHFGLFWVSKLMGLPMHSIFGDSLVLISWLNILTSLNVPSPNHWCDDIRSMLSIDIFWFSTSGVFGNSRTDAFLTM